MQWKIVRRGTKDSKITNTLFETSDDAFNHLSAMGPAFASALEIVPDTNDPKVYRMLTEGLVAGDMRRIILPQISVDEYVPGDPDTDNVVIAFFIKSVPESVIPFRDFIMKCRGIVDVAYGDSDTIPDASIVYAEMSRSNFKYDDLSTMMEHVGLLCDLDPSDFSILFPTTTKKHPYSLDVIKEYFERRSIEDNRKAQQDAFDKSQDDEDDNVSQEEMEEAMVEHLVESFGRN